MSSFSSPVEAGVAEPAPEDHYGSHVQNSNEKMLNQEIQTLLQRIRNLITEPIVQKFPNLASAEKGDKWLDIIQNWSSALRDSNHAREAEAFEYAINRCREDRSHGGLGLPVDETLSQETRQTVTFALEAWLQSLNSEDGSRKLLAPLKERPSIRRPMTLSQKILAHHSVNPVPAEGLAVGDLVTVSVDWVVSSELAWEVRLMFLHPTIETRCCCWTNTKSVIQGLRTLFARSGSKGIFRNDRLWLAGDHHVDPRNYNTPQGRKLLEASAKAETDFLLTDYQGPNYTIIHTEFVRERAEPGFVVIGADSRGCMPLPP